jgi:hypothetical protein
MVLNEYVIIQEHIDQFSWPNEAAFLRSLIPILENHLHITSRPAAENRVFIS